MGIFSNRRRSRKQWSSIESWRHFDNSQRNSSHSECGWNNNSDSNKFFRLPGSKQHGNLYNFRSWRSISIYSELFRTGDDQPDDHTTYHNNRKRHRHNKYLYAIGATLLGIVNPSVALANVGGVSATANPIANSSGSVTNQAIQVLQGPYITNTYGNQISCQGATFNATPYIQYSHSWKEPWEDYFLEPQYNASDFTGRTTTQTTTVKNYPWEPWYNTTVRSDPNDPLYDANEDGNPDRWWEDGADMQIEVEVDGPDGVPDNPGEVIWEKPVRTDQTANNNFNIGLSATISWPLDNKLQDLCKQAATTQIQQQQQLTANKRLDFEIARLKNCGELMQKGIMFHPKSPYDAICADVVVTKNPPGSVGPHTHNLPTPNFDKVIKPKVEEVTSSKTSEVPLSLDSSPVEPAIVPESKAQVPSSPSKPSLFQWPFSRQVSQPSEASPPKVSPEELKSWRLQQSSPWLLPQPDLEDTYQQTE